MAKDHDQPHLMYWEEDDIVEEEEEEEEALSLSDLPIESVPNGQPRQMDEENCLDESESKSEPEFEFGSWLGSMSTQPLPEMCAADDLFFQGRILPLRRHDSASHSSAKKSLDETNAGPVSRSDSMDSGSISRVTSTSSRSSSKGSQHSLSGSTNSSSTSFGSSRVRYSSVSNRFGSCPSPSPSPQTGFPASKRTVPVQANKSQRNSPPSLSSSSSSSKWEFFRPGLVRMPDIELHNLKIRATANNNNSCNNNNQKKKKGIVGFGLCGGCKCSADSVATNFVLLRSDSARVSSSSRRKSNVGSGEEEELRRKLMELIEIDDRRTRNASKKKEAMVEKHRDGRTSSRSRRRRTFEWVKELPHAAAGRGYYVLHHQY